MDGPSVILEVLVGFTTQEERTLVRGVDAGSIGFPAQSGRGSYDHEPATSTLHAVSIGLKLFMLLLQWSISTSYVLFSQFGVRLQTLSRKVVELSALCSSTQAWYPPMRYLRKADVHGGLTYSNWINTSLDNRLLAEIKRISGSLAK